MVVPAKTKTRHRLTVNENQWLRMCTSDGRVYYANRATGYTCWHMPTELYRSQMANGNMSLLLPKDLLMPSSAKAMKGIDCITNLPGKNDPHCVDDLFGGIGQLLEETQEVEPEPVQPYADVLKVDIISARGLRDADFLPGDTSDAFVTFSVSGKPLSWKTPVIFNMEDPVWNFTGHFTDFDLEEDTLYCQVWDSDSVGTSWGTKTGLEEDDDPLGAIFVKLDSQLCDGKPREYELVDKDRKQNEDPGYLTVALSLLSWPVVDGVPVNM